MNILSVEASTELCSAALYTDDNIFLRHQLAPKEHSKLLLNMVDELLQEATIGLAELNAFAYGMGPGSFTGLRIAASIVQGLAFGTNKQVIPISTLQALAQAAWRRFGYSQVFAALDARMQELYFGFYQLDANEIMQNLAVDEVGGIAEVLGNLPEEISNKTWYGVGSGVMAYSAILQKNLPYIEQQQELLYPSALEIAILASKFYAINGGKAAEAAVPVYVRNKITEKQGNMVSEQLFKK